MDVSDGSKLGHIGSKWENMGLLKIKTDLNKSQYGPTIWPNLERILKPLQDAISSYSHKYDRGVWSTAIPWPLGCFEHLEPSK